MSLSDCGISYRDDPGVSVAEFIDVLQRSGLAARRPVDDAERIGHMLAAYTFVCSAWSDQLLVGVATVWTDFAYSAYLADLAVDQAYQGRGIGKHLIELSQQKAGARATLILLAAPAAASYYPHIGMERFTDCFLLRRSK